jgi:hypothetical protein
MPGSDRYRPVDRWAYTARPLPRAGQVVRLALAAGVAALWFVAHDGTPWSRLAGPGLVVAYLAAVVWSLRRRASSLVVDAPGIYLGDAYVRENEERLVHWETVAGIVVFPGRGSRRPAAVGVRLRRHPGVVAVRRELDGWSVSRRKLASAVARYAPRWSTRRRARPRRHRRAWTTRSASGPSRAAATGGTSRPTRTRTSPGPRRGATRPPSSPSRSAWSPAS